MSTFLQVSGAIFWLSLGAGGLWVGLCLSVDWWRSRHEIPPIGSVFHYDGKGRLMWRIYGFPRWGRRQ